MEDLFPVILVIFGIIASIASSRKEKEKKTAEERRKAAVAARIHEAQQRQTQQKPITANKAAQPAAAPAPVRVAQPLVHTHLQPDCDTHDIPGSLGVTSTEGKDPCHEEQMTLERTFSEPTEQEGGLTFNWTGSSMVHAVVMQEVLTRPAQRRAR